MKLNRGLRRSLTDFLRHPWLHFISIATITASLCLLGTYFICFRNLEMLAENASPNASATAYLKGVLTEAEVAAVKDRILQLNGVQKVQFKGHKAIIEELHHFLGNASPENLADEGVFPDVLEIQLRAGVQKYQIENIKKELGKIESISEVDLSDDWLYQFQKVRNFLKVFGWILLVAIMVGCGFLIANFMGMRHQSRKEEIDLVQLMGASRSFILKPFFWEALLEGILGASCAIVLLFIAKTFFSTILFLHWSTFLGIKQFEFLTMQHYVLLLFVSIGMALLGSFTVFFRFREQN